MLLGTQHWNVFEFLNSVTGWDKSVYDYLEIGKRVQTSIVLQGVDKDEFVNNTSINGAAIGKDDSSSLYIDTATSFCNNSLLDMDQ